ncbi:hypothetical protein GF108_14395 [Phyllobacterium sp. SYP-B3895]|uniref:hypothetical protein n=1 Tax=Phyllobacterium sp. SYP-B3895 TaxID=2663240 RepID=UPI001299EBCA|nr:hypothetical protein [Phyllobacterium sp. SYP-B3895]MRG56767.1 hypothetical protein [Phyllobacterium sp. SYP-B3895]
MNEFAITGEEWFARLEMEPIDLAAHLRAVNGSEVVDIFNRPLKRLGGCDSF